jgi:hypothetical protein
LRARAADFDERTILKEDIQALLDKKVGVEYD